MKRAPTPNKPYTYGVPADAPRMWRSLDEFANSNAFAEAMSREFPEGASELDGQSRREFITLMGASVALAGLAGCRRPEENILPYARRGDTVVEGKSLHFATAIPFYGTALGLLVESHEGRPTKIEGNPLHPETPGGGSTAFVQASVLDLYDPDRSQAPAQKDRKSSWDEAIDWLRARGAAHKAQNGKKLAILTEAHRSPTLQALLDELKKTQPEAKVVRWEPFSRWASREGARLAFGRPLEAAAHVAKAKVILSLDSDFLYNESSPVKNARGFAEGRKLEAEGRGSSMNRLYVAESRFSVTGSNADHRLRLPSKEIHSLALAVAAACGVQLPGMGALDERKAKWARAVAKDLQANAGAALVFAGDKQPPAVHAIAHLLNEKLGGIGKTVEYTKPFTDDAEGPAALAALTTEMRKGDIETLLILGGNPVFDAPADLDFLGALGHVPNSAHLSTHANETSAATTWHLNRAHYLEQWSDVRAEDGTASVVQPLIAPIYGGKTDAEVLDRFLGGQRTAYQLVQKTWQDQGGLSFGKAWRKGLHEGVLEGTAYAKETPSAKPELDKLAAGAAPAGVEITFAPDSHVYDGRYANNGWMVELPDPMTKVCWDNVALVSPATARRLKVDDGDMLEITVAGKTVKLAALRAPGQADESIGLTTGFGRKQVGRVGKGTGFDTYPVRATTGLGFAEAQVVKAKGKHEIAMTQEHQTMDAPMLKGEVHHRPMVRETTLTKFVKKPDFVKDYEEPRPELLSLFPDYKYDGHKWSMVIDLNTCIGCSACTVACQAENNIPVVGKHGVMMSREMHWIRVDRYFTGEDENDPQAVMQPIGCQQCENAPCEQVCPVGATTHSPEGLNDMAYNRCIGTRYCANNCPFKVRRFNYFNYNKEVPELRRMQFNPEVTVRTRGIMEKCSYCVQRIQKAKIAAHRLGQDTIADGAVKSACQQACPAGAITFGNLNDKNAEVTKMAALPRKYVLLEELNVRPRTQFLGRVRNPNPELA